MIRRQRFDAMRIELLTVFVCVSVALPGGCSRPKPDEVVGIEAPAPSTAADAVRNVLAGLRRQELQALWEFLPPSYQSDIQELVHDFAERLDEKSWGPFVATVRKAHLATSQLLRLLDDSSKTASVPERDLAAQLRDVDQLLKALCESELTEVSRLRAMNAGQFLGGTGNRLIAAVSHGAFAETGLQGNSFEQFGEVIVGLSESAEKSAVLTVKWPGQPATQHKFVRVEQHWIPQSLAESWPTQFPIVRERILAWVDELRAHPDLWHARLREVDELLDELLASKSVAESRQVWQSGASRLAASWIGTTNPESPRSAEIPHESVSPTRPARAKRPDTEVLLPDEPQK